MKRYIKKIMRIINFIKNEGKFDYGDMVRIHDVLDEEYKKYNNKLGYVVNIDYSKKEFMFTVKFESKEKVDFSEKELTKIDYRNSLCYRKQFLNRTHQIMLESIEGIDNIDFLKEHFRSHLREKFDLEDELAAQRKIVDDIYQENEKLKSYQCKRNCAFRLKENNNVTDTEILDRLQEWLKCELALSKKSELYREKYESETYERCLEKILQLKEIQNE